MLVLPLILEEETADTHVLFEMTIVTEDYIIQSVEVVLCTNGKVGRHEEQLVERMHILRTCYVCKVVSGAVSLLGSLYVLLSSFARAAIITLAGCGLEREISRQTVILVRRIEVVGESATLDVVFYLLGYISHMGNLVELVAATAELMNAVIL